MPMADGRVKDAVLKHHRREFGGIFCYSAPITIRRHAAYRRGGEASAIP